MITPEDVERLLKAHENVSGALEKREPRGAARILCDEFNWLLKERGTFWADVKDATETLAQYREKEKRILSELASLVEQGEQIFAELGIDPSRTGPIIGNVYGALNLAQGLEGGPSHDSLKVLQERLAIATNLICKERKGSIRRGVDWVLSWKGATVLAGAVIVGANIAVTIPAPHHGAVSWVSVRAGLKVMRGELDGIKI